MEGILSEITVEAGVLLSALSLLAFVIGGILLGHLSEEERKGRRFFWAEWPLLESVEAFEEEQARRAA
jgi:hypothetical protein